MKDECNDIMSFFGIDTKQSDEEMMELNRATLLDDFLSIIDPEYASDKQGKCKPCKECESCGKAYSSAHYLKKHKFSVHNGQ